VENRRATVADRRCNRVLDNGGVSTEERTHDSAGQASAQARRVALLAGVAGVALLLDIITKIAVVANVEGRPPIKLAGGIVYLTVLRNTGAAYNLATGMTWLLALIAVGVVIAIIRLAPKLRSTGWALGLGLILGGATGNLIDRIFRAPGPLRGGVVDFISVFAPYGKVFPVFNVADSAITVGGALLVLLAIMGRDYNGSRARDHQPATPEQEAEKDKGSKENLA
jgi:signal peptidase II